MVREPSKGNRRGGKKYSKDSRRLGTATVCTLRFARSVQGLDVFASVGVGIVGGSTGQARLALARCLVELFADLEDFIFVLLVTVVIVLLGLLARDAGGLNERGGGIWEGLSVAELLICARGGSVGARLVHESSNEDGLAVCTAVRSNEKLHFLVLLLAIVVLLAVVVLLHVIIHTLAVIIVLKGIVVDVELPAFDGLLEIELHTIVAVVVVIIVVVFVFAVVETCVGVASGGIMIKVSVGTNTRISKL